MTSELVLLINDQAEIRETIVNRVFISQGYRTNWVQDLASGIAEIEKERPDVLVIDLDELTKGGKSSLETFLNNRYDIPIIALISDRLDAQVTPLLPMVRACVPKPVQAEALLAAVEQTLYSRRLRARLQSLETQIEQHIWQQRELYMATQAAMSAADEQQMLDHLIVGALNILNADEVTLFVRAPNSSAISAWAHLRRGQKPDAALPPPVSPDSLIEQTFKSGELTVLSGADAMAESSFAALILAPVQIQGHTIGVLRAGYLNTGELGITQAHWLALLATHVAAILNSEQLKDAIENEFERATAYRIGATFSSTLHLNTLLDLIVQEALQLTEAKRGYITLFEEQNKLYKPTAMHGIDNKTIGSAAFRRGRLAVRQALEEGKLLQLGPEPGDALPGPLMCVPLRDASEVFGAIYVDRPNSEQPFTAKQAQLFKLLAFQAAATIENARLFARAENERRKLEAVIRGTEQPVVITDMQGTVMLMNAAARQIFHTRRTMGTGMLLPQVIENADLKQLFQEAQTSGQVQRGEIPLDSGHTYSATVTPLANVGLVAILQDITRFKELSDLKSQFVAAVSHDLRSPLSTVLGFLDLLGQIGPLNELQKECVDSAQREVHHLIDLTSDLLDLGYLESGIDIEMRQCDLIGLIEAGLPNWRALARERRHQLEAHLPSEATVVYGNATRLRQVLDNLVSNAIKYTPEGGQIEIDLEKQTGRAVLRVRDTGIGISPEDQLHIFERFYRAHNNYTQNIEGTGLGLSIVKSIVERHNGRIWVESELGQGSTFVVVLPLAG